MGIRRSFRPSSLATAELETRLVLNGASVQAVPVLLQGLHRAKPIKAGKPVAATTLVDLAFDSFQQDYQSARATYLASVQNRTATESDKLAFTQFSTQRVNLLAQQVVNSLLSYTQTTTRTHRSADSLPVIQQKLLSTGDAKATPRSTGSLLSNLTATTPAADASPTTVALDTYAQDNAIAAARVNVLNGVAVIRNANYGSSTRKGH